MKKWIVGVLCVTLCLLLCMGTVNFLVDPFMQYRPLPAFFSFVAYSYDYVNPGMAKQTDYDAVLVGTSLAENTNMDLYEEAFGCSMIKMIYPGGTTRAFRLILDTVFRTHEPELVLWCFDNTFFSKGSSVFHHDMPEYLYDTNLLNDVSYLLNLSVFYNYTLKDTVHSLRGRSNRPILRGDVWSENQEFGPEAVMRAQPKDDGTQPETKSQDYFLDNVRDNLQTHVLPLLHDHPETQFYFFFPPKCVTHWRNALRNGEFDARFYAMRYIAQTLLAQSNARVFFFADRMEWTTDYDLYKDNIHYKQSVNDAMGEAMARGDSELTLENYEAVLEACAQTMRQAAQAIEKTIIQ